MSIENFAQLVAEMREAQKTFFRGHSTIDLQVAKRLERQVDEAIVKILNPPAYTQEALPL